MTKGKTMRGWLLNSLMALVCFGLWGFFPKIAVRYISPKSALIYEVMGGVLVAAVTWFSMSKGMEHDLRGVTPAFITGIVGYLGMFFFLHAVDLGKVSVVASLTAVYPVVTILLAAIILKEQITHIQYVGIFMAMTGVILISYR
jgi:transporter family protein